MIKTNNILMDKKRVSDKKGEYRRIYKELLQNVGIITRKRLLKINNMIEEIVKQIEETSGWEYYDNHFRSRTNFTYDKDSNEITFQVNMVERENQGYHSVTSNSQEEKFLKRYDTLLKRIAVLEQKKEDLLQANKEKVEEARQKVVVHPSTREVLREQEEKEGLFLHSWTDIEMDYFISKYGIEGLSRLIKLMNQLVDYDTPIDAYNAFIRENTTKDFKSRTLSWISVYTASGEKWLDKYYDEEQDRNRWLEEHPKTYRKTEGVIPFPNQDK